MSDLARLNRKTLHRSSTSQQASAAPLRLATSTVMSVHDLHKSYRKGPLEVPVLKGVDLEVRTGDFTAIIGQSGSGKSTLLHLLGTLDQPDQGEIHFDGQRIDNLPARKKEALRNRQFGMIFQFYHLLPELTTLENVLVPLTVEENLELLSDAGFRSVEIMLKWFNFATFVAWI